MFSGESKGNIGKKRVDAELKYLIDNFQLTQFPEQIFNPKTKQ